MAETLYRRTVSAAGSVRYVALTERELEELAAAELAARLAAVDPDAAGRAELMVNAALATERTRILDTLEAAIATARGAT